jgi:hypothetical protein
MEVNAYDATTRVTRGDYRRLLSRARPRTCREVSEVVDQAHNGPLLFQWEGRCVRAIPLDVAA